MKGKQLTFEEAFDQLTTEVSPRNRSIIIRFPFQEDLIEAVKIAFPGIAFDSDDRCWILRGRQNPEGEMVAAFDQPEVTKRLLGLVDVHAEREAEAVRQAEAKAAADHAAKEAKRQAAQFMLELEWQPAEDSESPSWLYLKLADVRELDGPVAWWWPKVRGEGRGPVDVVRYCLAADGWLYELSLVLNPDDHAKSRLRIGGMSTDVVLAEASRAYVGPDQEDVMAGYFKVLDFTEMVSFREMRRRYDLERKRELDDLLSRIRAKVSPGVRFTSSDVVGMVGLGGGSQRDRRAAAGDVGHKVKLLWERGDLEESPGPRGGTGYMLPEE